MQEFGCGTLGRACLGTARLLAMAIVVWVSSSVAVRAEEPATNEDRKADYVLGVEDRLSISVWHEPELLQTVTVRPDGKVTFPLVGDVQASGRTPTELDEELTEKLSKYIREPVVTVVVVEINAFKVYVLGEVAAQGALTLRRPTRLLEAIAQCGGLSAYADKSKVVVVRLESGRESRITIDYKRVLSGERPEQNIFLKPGDTIIAN